MVHSTRIDRCKRSFDAAQAAPNVSATTRAIAKLLASNPSWLSDTWPAVTTATNARALPNATSAGVMR